jgi:hypothetical protein
MSYCRNNGKDSDVWVIATKDRAQPFWSCVNCSLAAPRITGQVEVRWTECDTPQEMIWHLLKHRTLGDKVPQRALDRLCEEAVGVVPG